MNSPEESNRIFCLPFNGDDLLATRLVERHNPQIFEFYGTDDKFASARRQQHHAISSQALGELIRSLKQSGIRFNYLLNSVTPFDYIHNEPVILEHLQHLQSFGLATVTCSVPHLTRRIAELGLEVSTSVTQAIDTAIEVQHMAAAGYSRMIVKEDLTRMLPTLRSLICATECHLELLVNSTCLLGCPFRATHWAMGSCSDPQITEDDRRSVKAAFSVCKKLWHDDSTHFLKGSWVRPQDIPRYINEGIKYFKVAGRDKNSHQVERACDAYLSGVYKGPILQLLKPDAPLDDAPRIARIPAEKLDDYFNFFFDPTLGCVGSCSTCHYCQNWATRLEASL